VSAFLLKKLRGKRKSDIARPDPIRPLPTIGKEYGKNI